MTAKTRILTIVLLVVFGVIAAFVGWRLFGSDVVAPPIDQGTPFRETGNVVINNPGYKPDTWFLVYEAQGSPALQAELAFSAASVCALTSGEKQCPEGLTSGMRATVEGRLRDERVSVDLLTEVVTMRDVSLYYYNWEQDTDGKGDVVGCSRKGLDPVLRAVPETATIIPDTIALLLEGNLSNEERAKGITTEFPLNGVRLVDSELVDGTLTLTFDDPQNATGGGACRVGVLWYQIEETARQFPEVQRVRFAPEELFQP